MASAASTVSTLHASSSSTDAASASVLASSARSYAGALYEDAGATLDDLREAVTTLVETERIVRRVMGGAHPTTTAHEAALQEARAVLSARETSPTSNNA